MEAVSIVNAVKSIFSNLNEKVSKEPLMGLIILIACVAGSGSIIYNFGKSMGTILFELINK